MEWKYHNDAINFIWYEEGGGLYTVTKYFLIGLASWALFYFHKIYFYTFWSNSDNFLQRVMRYDLFVEKRFNILRISDTYKKSFICILLRHCYIPHINNLLLIPDLFARPMITCLWRYYWLHDVFMKSSLASWHQTISSFDYLPYHVSWKKSLLVNWVQCNVLFLNKVRTHFECKFEVYLLMLGEFFYIHLFPTFSASISVGKSLIK